MARDNTERLKNQVLQALRSGSTLHEYGTDSLEIETMAFTGGGRAFLYLASELQLTNNVVSKGKVVVKAVHIRLCEKAAGNEEVSKRLLQYFTRELFISQRINHPNIIKLLGFVDFQPYNYSISNVPSLVFPYYPAGDLRLYVVKSPSQVLSVRLWLLLGVANALYHLHSRREPIVHRDVKGTNVLVHCAGGNVHAILADLGSAKLQDANVPFVEQSSLAYSVAWAPPEYVANGVAEGPGVISFRQPTTQGDIWSFGCLFYEVMTTVNPWAEAGDYVENLKRGESPPYPTYDLPENSLAISHEHWNTMQACWRPDGQRLPAQDLVTRVEELYAAAVKAEAPPSDSQN